MSNDSSDRPPPIGPTDATKVPRYAGANTFARLPEMSDVTYCDVAVLGVPFDGGVSYRPGARFGPQAVRQASRMLRSQYHPEYDVQPFATLQSVDAGDVACNPFSITESLAAIEAHASGLLGPSDGPHPVGAIVTIGGDHTIAYSLLKSVNRRFGQVALVHFDAHLDTWDTYWGEPFTHGTPFRRAGEEGLFDPEHSMHVGIRGPLYSRDDIPRDEALGFKIVTCDELHRQGVDDVVRRIRARVGDRPMYLSIDIDVLDPAHAPGTGTPEIAGMSSRELVMILRGLAGLELVSADVVEVAPAYDHAEITSLAAATVVYELICLLARRPKIGSN
jgi:agmatinase